jgi:hypothetical protein
VTSPRRLILAASIAALVVSASGTAAALDKPKKQVVIKARIAEVNYDRGFDFSGLVETKKACRDDRRASLLYSTTMTGPQQKIGSDKTSRSGDFDIHLSFQPQAGYYSVAVTKDREDRGELTLVCKPTVSARYLF